MVQLIYASAAVIPFTSDQLTILLAKARTKNAMYGVTGMLVYEAGSFLQVLEGDDAAVDRIFTSISKDPRHTNHKLLARATVQQREFSDWSMGFINKSANLTREKGYVDYDRALPELVKTPTQAKKLLRFFRDGLCRQVA